MSGAMFPTYNAGKVIGEINWIYDTVAATGNVVGSAGIKEIVIPINRNEINEIVFSTNYTDSIAKKFSYFYSSESNQQNRNYALSLRQMSVGSVLFSESVTQMYSFQISLLSETNDSFILKISYGKQDYRKNAEFMIGWR